MHEAAWVFLILGLTLAGFVWGRYRYDLVALFALFAGVLTGVILPASVALTTSLPS